MLLILTAFKDSEILRLAENYDLSKVLKDLHYTECLSTFVSATLVPQDRFMEIGVADSFFTKVEEVKVETTVEVEKAPPHPSELIASFLSDPGYDFLVTKIVQSLEPGKYEYVMRACAILVNTEEPSFQGTLELNRFMIALSYVEASLSIEEVWLLCEVSKTGSLEDDPNQGKHKVVAFQQLLRSLRRGVPELNILFQARPPILETKPANDLDSECSEEIDDEKVAEELREQERLRKEALALKCTQFDEVEINSFDGVEGGLDDITQVAPEEVPQAVQEPTEETVDEDEEEEKMIVGVIAVANDWNEGEFEVNINRCTQCANHFQYCRHSEDEFVTQFNDLGDFITHYFPNATVIGNYEKPQMMGEFEVYMRGVGPKSQRDNLDRYFLFRKSQRNRFPEREEVIDHIVCLALMYGGTKPLGVD